MNYELAELYHRLHAMWRAGLLVEDARPIIVRLQREVSRSRNLARR